MRHRHLLALLFLIGASACRDETPVTSPVSVPDQPRPALSVAGGADLRAGDDYVCRLYGGVITCFGNHGEGRPTGWHKAAAGTFVQLTAGPMHACGLRSDGVVECFGSNQYGEAPPLKQAAAGAFTQVSAGLAHTCAVRTDGVMECWGSNANGQAPPVVTAQSGAFTAVTASASRTCALRTDGVVECRGYREGTPSIKTPPAGTTYVKLWDTVGATICLARSNGMLECWGNQASFYIGPYAEAVVGASHICALDPDGTPQCSGYEYSWKGPGPADSVTSRPWVRITAGSYHTCGLRPDGHFQCFGWQTIGSDAPDVIPWADTPASALTGGRIRVSWRDVNSNDLRTEIERSVADDAGKPTSWTSAGATRANYTGFTDSLAAPGAVYLYHIRVCNDAGCSAWAQSNATRYPKSVPPTPAVTSSGYVCGYASCARVAWTVDNTFVDSFRIQRRAYAGSQWGAWENVAALGRESTGWDDYGLTFKTRYQYQVRACNVLGCSPFAVGNSFVAPTPPPPAAPATLSAAMIYTQMHIVWGDVVNETTYELQRRQYDGTAFGPWSDPVVRTENVTSDDQAVKSGTLYQWRIRACNPGGCSAYTLSPETRA